LELFTTEGYHSSTTPLIAARAGIAEGTIYRHFESKEQLLNEIYRAAIRMLAAPVRESSSSMSCKKRLEHITAVWKQIAFANPPLIKLSMVQDLEKVIAAGKGAGEVRAGSARIWAEVWLKLVVLVLERIASGEWPQDHPGPQQVLDSAWTAISAPTP
jgi:AcrR family transcriptional regulator